ncbi:hypothetical protein MferCBS49748_000249 [Microsporum ferrugineum]
MEVHTGPEILAHPALPMLTRRKYQTVSSAYHPIFYNGNWQNGISPNQSNMWSLSIAIPRNLFLPRFTESQIICSSSGLASSDFGTRTAREFQGDRRPVSTPAQRRRTGKNSRRAQQQDTPQKRAAGLTKALLQDAWLASRPLAFMNGAPRVAAENWAPFTEDIGPLSTSNLPPFFRKLTESHISQDRPRSPSFALADELILKTPPTFCQTRRGGFNPSPGHLQMAL